MDSDPSPETPDEISTGYESRWPETDLLGQLYRNIGKPITIKGTTWILREPSYRGRLDRYSGHKKVTLILDLAPVPETEEEKIIELENQKRALSIAQAKIQREIDSRKRRNRGGLLKRFLRD